MASSSLLDTNDLISGRDRNFLEYLIDFINIECETIENGKSDSKQRDRYLVSKQAFNRVIFFGQYCG